jgi:hypothetical protein
MALNAANRYSYVFNPVMKSVFLNRFLISAVLCVAALLVSFRARAQSTNSQEKAKDGAIAGYLFAHMTKGDYGRLYYSLSSDGLRWKTVNDGKRVLGAEYWGHPDICRGNDGRYYLIGNITPNRDVSLWVSTNLVGWTPFQQLRLDVTKVPGCAVNFDDHGAPKIFFDTASANYIITWHTSVNPKSREDTELFWRGQRTLYIQSKDLRTFTEPRRLFPFEMATIDVILRPESGRYFAIIKDERMPAFDWPTGKSIRIASAPTPFGPWSEPSPRVSPNFREAPMVIPKPDGSGWFLYYEQYPGVSYGLSTAPKMEGPWHDVYWADYSVPASARHGCMIPITTECRDAIINAYGNP